MGNLKKKITRNLRRPSMLRTLLLVLLVLYSVMASQPKLKVDRNMAGSLRGNSEKFKGYAANRMDQALEALEGVQKKVPEQLQESARLAEQKQTPKQAEPGCDGVPGGDAVVDDCGVCNGNNEDMDACGECFGNGDSCCNCFLGFCNEGWDQLLLIESIDDMIRQFKALRLVLDAQCNELNKLETVGCFDVPEGFGLPIGTYAECNFSYLLNCLSGFPDLVQLMTCDHDPCDPGCPDRPEECMITMDGATLDC